MITMFSMVKSEEEIFGSARWIECLTPGCVSTVERDSLRHGIHSCRECGATYRYVETEDGTQVEYSYEEELEEEELALLLNQFGLELWNGDFSSRE